MDFLAALLSGGATGILGTVFGRVLGFFENQQKFEHELKLLEIQGRQRVEEKEIEAAIAESKAASDLRQVSYAHDTAAGKGSLWVINTIRLVRPTLTLLALLGVLTLWLADSLSMEQRGQIITAIIYLATTSMCWWFGDRAPQGRR